MADIAVLDAVGIDQRVVDVADMVVLFQQFVVLLAQQVAHPDQLFVTALQTAVLPKDEPQDRDQHDQHQMMDVDVAGGGEVEARLR